jgi:CheY-like chemotaxis protein
METFCAQPKEETKDVVLLADDSDDDIALFKRAYVAAGIDSRLRVVRDGDEVIAYLKGEARFHDRARYPLPGLLILDVNMPRKDGFEVIQWVRHQSQFKSLKIVVLTSSGDRSDAKKAYAAGANTFVVKSMELQEFVRQLKEIKSHWI